MTTGLAWIGVAVFGATGAYARFYLAGAVTSRYPSDFPFGTFTVNLIGGFLLGLLEGLGVQGTYCLCSAPGCWGLSRRSQLGCWRPSG